MDRIFPIMPDFYRMMCDQADVAVEATGAFVRYMETGSEETLNEVRRGFVQCLADSGLRDGTVIRLLMRNAMGDSGEARRIAQEFVDIQADLLVALSTQCLQAALLAAPRSPILFTSVANPHLLGIGKFRQGQGGRITGVASTAPIKQTLAFIREALPGAGRIGTLWTPAELNSEYYLKLLREGCMFR